MAATLKYADAILKTLATAGSIVISTVLGHIFLSGPLNLVVSIGALTVIMAIFNYTMDVSIATVSVLKVQEVEVEKERENSDSDVESSLVGMKDGREGEHYSLKTRKAPSKDHNAQEM